MRFDVLGLGWDHPDLTAAEKPRVMRFDVLGLGWDHPDLTAAEKPTSLLLYPLFPAPPPLLEGQQSLGWPRSKTYL